MVKRVLGADDNDPLKERIAEWIAQRIPGFSYGATPFTCIGLMNEVGTLCAGVLFENYTYVDIHGHIAAECLTRHFIGEFFRHCFVKLGVDRMTAPVVASNAKGAKFVEDMGFTLEGRMRRLARSGEDMLIYGLLREECRWLNVGIKYVNLGSCRPLDRAEHVHCRT